MNIVLQHHIKPKFQKFRDIGLFIDCKVTDKNEIEIPCHRHVLANYSKWFWQYFRENPITSEIQEVMIPINPGNLFSNVVDFLYSGMIKINEKNLPFILKFADFYEIELLEMIANELFIELQNNSNILYFSKCLVKFELSEKALTLAPHIARELAKLLRKEHSAFTLEDIFDSTNPQVFSAILNHTSMNDFSDSVKADLIDRFVGSNDIQLSDKQFLATVFNWAKAESFNLLINHRCDWVPPEISRKLYIQILDYRRRDIEKFVKDIRPIEENSSRWFLFSWLHSIRYSLSCINTITVSPIHFISHLGFLNHQIDTIKYGLLTISSSNPISPEYDAKYAFLDQGYFVTATDKKDLPFITVDFGNNAHFKLSEVRLTCASKTPFGILRPAPKAFRVVGKAETTTLISKNVVYETLPEEADMRIHVVPGCNKTFREFKIMLEMQQDFPRNVFRVVKIEFKGSFLANANQ